MSVRVRFAPSPTGQVHIGNIRAAIFNWLFARHEGGKFLLRMEDTDKERSTPQAVQAVFDAMEWLKLSFDEEPLYQSSRLPAHVSAAEDLVRKGAAYREDKGGTGKGECVVFRMPREDVTFHDEIKGDLRKKADDLKDFVILRSDGTPVFHLANVVDDIEMGITHIIRGDDHIENTYKHVPLFRALGAPTPRYAHLPMIVNAQGKPYSKRDGAVFVGEFRERGFHPDAVFNYLTLLGWSPGDDREKLSRAEMTSLFSLDRVKSGPAQMDERKLMHLNSLYVTEQPLGEFARCVKSVLSRNDWARDIDEKYFEKVCALLQSRTVLYPDAEKWKYFFSDDIQCDEKAVGGSLCKPGVKDALARLGEKLAAVDFSEEAIERAIRETEKEVGLPEGKLNQPARIAVTGLTKGAGIYETAALMGKSRVTGRLARAAERLRGGNDAADSTVR